MARAPQWWASRRGVARPAPEAAAPAVELPAPPRCPECNALIAVSPKGRRCTNRKTCNWTDQ